MPCPSTRFPSWARLGFRLFVLFATRGNAISWGSGKLMPSPMERAGSTPAELLQTRTGRSEVYEVALKELQDLELEPLCHRVAARLLVNNCQLVDGKDEASILTDSGRQVRDFIDSYAASLAICDLERGSFSIPSPCTKFREPALTQLALSGQPQLHVSTTEIDRCLTSLASSDSAWNTWVSYRHKALRFCEAARADNDKAQSILLYQRLTQVIGKLVEGVELELQKRLNDLDLYARQTADNLERLNPEVDRLRGGLEQLQDYLATNLKRTMKQSTESMHDTLRSAGDLQQLLSVFLKTVLDVQSQMASAHEHSLQHVSKRTDNEMASLLAVVGAATASSVVLQQQMEASELQAQELASRQNALEEGMDRLVDATESLTSKYNTHSHVLTQAHNMTNDILDVLEATASIASTVRSSALESPVISSWWPYIVFPPASLVMGSYGLPPSILRNIALLALGEAIALMFSMPFSTYLDSVKIFGLGLDPDQVILEPSPEPDPAPHFEHL